MTGTRRNHFAIIVAALAMISIGTVSAYSETPIPPSPYSDQDLTKSVKYGELTFMVPQEWTVNSNNDRGHAVGMTDDRGDFDLTIIPLGKRPGNVFSREVFQEILQDREQYSIRTHGLHFTAADALTVQGHTVYRQDYVLVMDPHRYIGEYLFAKAAGGGYYLVWLLARAYRDDDHKTLENYVAIRQIAGTISFRPAIKSRR